MENFEKHDRDDKEREERIKRLKEIRKIHKIPRYIYFKSFMSMALLGYTIHLLYNWYTISQIRLLLEEANNWLRVNSIISNPLYIPWNDWRLDFSTASAWLWNWFDFRSKHFSLDDWNIAHLIFAASFYFFPLDDDLVNNDSDVEALTPDWYFDLFNIEHLMTFTKGNIWNALKYWAIRETDYEDALKRADKEEYLKDAEYLWILGKKVLQVTPKWNGLVFLDKSWWHRSPPLPDKESEFPEWELSPIWAWA